jgi:hypothetical protein
VKISYDLQPETSVLLEKLHPQRVVSAQASKLGLKHGEPLLVAMDAMLRYAKAYRNQYDRGIADDSYAGADFHSILEGLNSLLSMDGGVAYELDITTDSKDNGILNTIYIEALKAGGYEVE